MAKGNLFLGMGRGKVGDVVFYRMNGQQMARVRNRTPKNPRSNEQLYQRAVIASVMKAYSQGKEIFDHSFQNYTIGEGNMRRFNSVNARILRAALFDDINGGKSPELNVGRFCAPRSVTCTPIIGLQASEGTLTNNLIITEKKSGLITFKWAGEGYDTTSKVVDWLNDFNISAGDIFTFVYFITDLDNMIYQNPWFDSNLASQYNTKFGWLRLIVKDDIKEAWTFASMNIRNLFQVEMGGEILPDISKVRGILPGRDFGLYFNLETYGGVAACIKSRNDYDLRSTEYMQPIETSDFGIASAYVLNAWQDEVLKIGESELILEGGDAGVPTNGNNPEGPSEQPIEEGVDTQSVITNSPKNMRPARRTARHRGTSDNPE